ncbi:MAG TPA: XRE family transcriptional regulator [Longimicrobium sp.]|nr:XRE family transcriptional regulator [Longimicrobium sp.]
MSEHVTPVGGNVFADLGFAPEAAANLLIRTDLMMEIEDIIEQRKLRQKDAACLFGVSQPRISDLVRGKIDTFTIDSLVTMLAHAGVSVELKVRRAA